MQEMNQSNFGIKKYTILNKIMKIKRCILGIPARLDSSRLPNKILADINGQPMIKRVLERCSKAIGPKAVVLCTDSDELKFLAEKWGYKVLLTSSECSSGSERIASVVDELIAIAWADKYSDKELFKSSKYNSSTISNEFNVRK